MGRVPRNRQSSYFVPALEKGLDILEALASSPKSQSLADLSRSLDRTSSEIFRMVDTLEKRNYIVRDPGTGEYRLSMKLYELSHMHSPVDSLVRAASGPLRELSSEVNESCHLAVISGEALVVVAEELSPARVRLSVEVGSRAPVLQTVSGRLLLAHLDERAREEFLARDAEFGNMSRAKKDALREELERVRAEGCAVSTSAYRTGVDLAVVVGNPDAGVAASLAIPVLAGGINDGKEQALLRALRHCARKINDCLGLSGRVEQAREAV